MTKIRMTTIHNWKEKDIDLAISTERKLAKGKTITCTHTKDWWQHAKQCPGGHYIFCDRCGQFFIKGLGMPQIIAIQHRPNSPIIKGTDHIEGAHRESFFLVRPTFITK